MRIFVYEDMTATGAGRTPGDPFHLMYCEGRAMRDALAEDVDRVAGWRAEVVTGTTGGDHDGVAREVAGRCDYTIVIAPETGGRLERVCDALRSASGTLLAPTPGAIRLTTDKLALATHWREHGVPTPATTDREPTACDAFPVVWKPRDGAGSVATFILTDGVQISWAQGRRAAEGHTGAMVVQEFVPGNPASVGFLCGPGGHVPLIPVSQHLSGDGRCHYLGGSLPLPAALAARAVGLASRAVKYVPGLLGYVGVDLVLGDRADCSGDYAIEINPRLTTSYVGLRAATGGNLAEALVKIGTGLPPPELSWAADPVRFAADGRACPLAPTP